MKYRPNLRELFDILGTEINLLAEKTDGYEHVGKIKAISLMIEDRVNELYKQMKLKNKTQEKPESLESRTETCVCGQAWVYEDTFYGRAFGRVF